MGVATEKLQLHCGKIWQRNSRMFWSESL